MAVPAMLTRPTDTRPRASREVTAGRPLVGLAGATAAIVVVTAACLPFRDDLTPATPALLYLLPVGIAALVGGRAVAILIALVTAATYSVAFIPPIGSLRVELREDLVGLVVFVTVAVTMSTLVGRETSRRRQAEQRERDVAEMYDRYLQVAAERERLAAEAGRVEVLEEVDRQRKALLRSVSHDLRSPLATIATVVSGIRAGLDYDEATRNELLGLVESEVQRLDRVVANLLSLSRVEAGALEPNLDTVDVRDIVQGAAARLGSTLGGRFVPQLADDVPVVLADSTQLDLVVTNLLEERGPLRACRHARRGPRRGRW